MTDYKKELRDMKIDIISGDRKIGICQEAIERNADALRFIARELPDATITGSLALNLYGALERDINDVDVIIQDKSKYSHEYYAGHLYGYATPNELPGRLGYVDYTEPREKGILGLFRKRKKWKADFFESPTAAFRTFEFEGNTLRIQELMDIVEMKCAMVEYSLNYGGVSSRIWTRGYDDGTIKHRRDLLAIFNQ